MDKVKWGVLGTAGIAKGCTIPGMQEAKNCELYAIAGRDSKKVEEYKTQFGFEKGYVGYEELLADPKVCAVYIPLPNQLHYEWTIKALKAKKHVLCEKPIAPSAKQAEEMFAAAKENGVILMEAFAYLHSPYIKALQEEMKNQTIGEIRYIESAFYTSNYDLSNIRMRKECFGGAAYDLGCYCTSMILRLLEKEPQKVKCVADYSDEGVDLLTAGFMEFEGELRAGFNCGMIFEREMDRRFDRLYIHGSDGDIKSYTEFNQNGDLSYTVHKDGKEETKTIFATQNYCLEVEQLGRCILENEEPLVSPEFSIMNARVLDKIMEQI